MKVNYVKVGIFSVLGIATIYGGYRLHKYFKDKAELARLEQLIKDSNSQQVIADNLSSNQAEKQIVVTPAFDGNKVISKGSTGAEAKTIQLALNNIIEDAKKVNLLALSSNYKPAESTSASTALLEPYKAQIALDNLIKVSDRVKQIASLQKLATDGNFGAKSESVCQVIMGEKSTTYNKVMQKRINFAKAYGLPNPYKK
jgi:hypothetical protein